MPGSGLVRAQDMRLHSTQHPDHRAIRAMLDSTCDSRGIDAHITTDKPAAKAITGSAEPAFGIQPSMGLADVLGARSVRGDSSADRQLCGIDGRLWRPTLTVADARYRHIPNDMRDEP
jgi:hypothetical protein